MNTMCITHYQTQLDASKIAVSQQSDLPSNQECRIHGYLTSATGSKKPLTISITVSSISNFNRYLYLSTRIKSFGAMDTTNNFVGVQFLARNINTVAEQGFYYAPKEKLRDRVQCIMCSGILHSWEENDNPQKEHRSNFPKCPGVLNGICEFSFEAPSEPTEIPQTEEITPHISSIFPSSNTPHDSQSKKSTFDQYPENQFREENIDLSPVENEAYILSIAFYPSIDDNCNQETYPTEKRRDFNKCLQRYFVATQNSQFHQAQKQIYRLQTMKEDRKDEDFVSDDSEKGNIKKACIHLLKQHNIIQHSDTSSVLDNNHMKQLIDCINNNTQPHTNEIHKLNDKRIRQEAIILVLNAYEETGQKMNEAIEKLKITEDLLIKTLDKPLESDPSIKRQNACIDIPPIVAENLLCFAQYKNRLQALNYAIVLNELKAVDILPEHLAESGFFPLVFDRGTSHSYQCFACAGIIFDMEKGDNVFIEHARFCPQCPMVHAIGSDHP